jgi:hypothetical protein
MHLNNTRNSVKITRKSVKIIRMNVKITRKTVKITNISVKVPRRVPKSHACCDNHIRACGIAASQNLIWIFLLILR